MNDMRAALYDRYGPPEVLYEGKVPVPSPGRDEVLVRIHAAGVNGGDLHGRAGHARLLTGRRFPQRVGIDFAGEIASAADAPVTGLQEGDRVWGLLPRFRFGSAAEYVAVRPRQLSRAPEGVSLVQAAALPVTGTTALTALVGKARLKPGERLLVRGAGGGVGNVAVQLGKALGAQVTGLAGPANLAFIRELGADEALSYTTTHPTGMGDFDVVLDTVGTQLPAYRRLLRPGGRMVAISFDPRKALPFVSYLLASTVHGSRRVRFFSGDPRSDLLDDLTRYVESGAVRPVVDSVHPLSGIADAHRALEAGGVRGKHVIQVL
ncbi:NAD(P)-dependent alcohol dehydrogenase [Streptomyces sp. NPDC004752]